MASEVGPKMGTTLQIVMKQLNKISTLDKIKMKSNTKELKHNISTIKCGHTKFEEKMLDTLNKKLNGVILSNSTPHIFVRRSTVNYNWHNNTPKCHEIQKQLSVLCKPHINSSECS
jgi:hypothetical protein